MPPPVILLLLTPIEILTERAALTILWRPVNCMRLAVTAVAAVNKLTSLCFHWNQGGNDIVMQIIILTELLSFAWLFLLLVHVKKKGFTRSAVVWIFALVSSITSGLNFYAIVAKKDTNAIDFYINLINLASCFSLLILSSFADRFLPAAGNLVDRKISPQDVVSFPSFLMYWFVTPLALRGWKCLIGEDDLFPISASDRTDVVSHDFRKHMQRKKDGEKEESRDVSLALIRTFKFDILQLATAKATLDATDLLKALALKWLMDFIHDPRQPDWHGSVILSLFMLVSAVNSISWNARGRLSVRTAARMRSALRSAIYRKSLTMSMSARRDRSVGQFVNLMAVDADKLRPLMDNLHSCWTSPLQIGIAFWLLHQELGDSTFYGLAVVILLLLLNTILLFYMKTSQKTQMKTKDQRVKTMNEILTGIKLIKLYAWEKAFMHIVSQIRRIEVQQVAKIVAGNAVIQFNQKAAPTMAALATFAACVFSDHGQELTPAKVLFSIAIFNIIKIPLTNLPKFMKEMTTFLVCRKRLNDFLMSADIQPYVDRSSSHPESPIRLQGADLNWDDSCSSDIFSIKIDNLRVASGSLVAVVGPVGSGKSSLISAILGEMHLNKGSVSISSEVRKIAYVPQQAWILNQTVKENIVFRNSFSEQKYQQVVRMCELEPDLLLLPAGDETEIGERGINLSGGQKQRISIARACYSDADLFLFDDPLSAVDAHVAKKLFDNLLSSHTGMLRCKTRVLVTNNLFVLPAVDHVFVLDNGRVCESGSYERLVSSGSSLLANIQVVAHNELANCKTRNDKAAKKISSQSPSVENKEKHDNKLIKAEKRTSAKMRTKIYAFYFKHMSGLLCMIVVGMLLSQLFEVASNIWLSNWSTSTSVRAINATVTTTENDDDNKVFVYLGMGVLSTVTLLAACAALARGSVNAAVCMHDKLLFRIMRSPITFFETTPTGRIVNRFSTDMDGIDVALPDAILNVSVNALIMLGTVTVVVISVPLLVLAFIPIGVGIYFVQSMYIRSVRQVRGEDSRCCSFLFSFFSESITGASAIRAYNMSEQSIAQAEHLIDRNQVCTLTSSDLNRWRSTAMQLVGLLLILATGIAAVASKGSDTSTMIGLALTYSIQISFVMNYLCNYLGEFETRMVSVERLLEYSSHESEAEWSLPHSPQAQDWPSTGAIHFQNYSARYRPELGLVVRDVAIEIKGKEKVGIVGRTGAGKSTIAAALFRLMEPASGRILIDGVDIASIGLHDLRSKLTVIPQDPVLFSGTVRRNLDPLNEKTDDEVWHALRLSHLSSFVSSLPGALLHHVSEGGDNLSVGQRQLMCLGRALLRDTRILIMDEATAAVDAHTDSLIQETIREQFKECTVLTIAHRLHTILDSDRVLVMDEGRVAEFDSPTRLLQDPHSIFFSLARDARIV